MSLYSSLGNSYSKSIGYAGKVGVGDIQKKYSDRIFDEKMRQREQNFAALGEIIQTGASLYSMYTGNAALIGFAKSKGYDVASNKFSQYFGNPQFSKDGKTYSSQQILNLRAYDDYRDAQSLYDVIGGE